MCCAHVSKNRQAGFTLIEVMVDNAVSVVLTRALSLWPTTQEGLEALNKPPQGAKNWPEGGYIKGGFPKDGWDNDLQYVIPGTEGRTYDLFSLGADGKQGGEGQDADIFAKL